MALRDGMRQSAQQFLQPGEPIQAVAGAQTHSQYLIFAGGIIFLSLNNYRMIVATPSRILVLNTGKWGMKKARGVVAELPRSTRLSGGSGVWHTIELGPESKLRVHRRFFKDLQAMDAQAPAYAPPPAYGQYPPQGQPQQQWGAPQQQYRQPYQG